MIGQRGFTLIEVMIAITVFSLIMLSALSAMRTLGKINTRVVDTTQRSDELRSVNHALRQLLEQLQMSDVGSGRGGTWGAPGGGGEARYFIGSPHEVSWLAPLVGVAGVSGLHYLRLRVAGEQLILDIAPYDPPNDEPDWGATVASPVLLTGVGAFDAAYRAGRDEPWTPHIELDDRSALQAIRLRLRVGGRYWPDLVVAPPALQGRP